MPYPFLVSAAVQTVTNMSSAVLFPTNITVGLQTLPYSPVFSNSNWHKIYNRPRPKMKSWLFYAIIGPKADYI